jgi:FMN phosphatase YigB (HAD superfamily)
MIRLQTVDVWDTLLRRRCHPDAVKLHLAGWMLTRCWPDIPAPLRKPRALLALRLDAERELARAAATDPSRDDEYQWREVLDLWVRKALGTKVIDDALLDALEAEELAQEQRVGYADPGIAALLAARPQVPTLFLSDFYMSATRLSTLLDAQGLGGLVEGGLSSCDIGLNKRSGRLYLALHRLHGVIPADHRHLGDNRETDIRAARRLGIAAEHYRNRAEDRRCAFNRRVFKDRSLLFRSLTRDALALLPMPEHRDARRAFRFGIQCAPLFIGFCLYLLEAAGRERCGQLFFLSREGAFFAEIYAVLRDACASPGNSAPPALHLDISRRASFAASLQAVSVDEMKRLWRGHEPATMRAWILSLNLDPATAQTWCRNHGLDPDEPLTAPAADPRVRAVFEDHDCRAALAAHIAAQAALLRDYLAQQGLHATARRAGVVDIGWRGTIQDNLALLLPDVHFSGYYLGLQGFLNPQPANTAKCAYGPDLNRSTGQAALFRRLPLIEMLCTPPQGGVLGYERATDGRVQSRRTDDEHHDSAIWRTAVAPFQAGVMQALPPWTEALRLHAVDSSELHGEAMACWRRIMEQAPTSILLARAELAHDERFGHGRHAPPRMARRAWSRPWS